MLLLWLETTDTTIWNPQDNCDRDKREVPACSAITIFAEFQFEDNIFGIFPTKSKRTEDSWRSYTTNGRRIPLETSLKAYEMLEVSYTFHVLPL